MHQVATAAPPPALSPAKRKKRRRRILIFGGVGVVLLFIIISAIAGKREQPIEVVTEKAIRKTIIETVSATGKVQPETEVKISPEVAGEIIELPVEDGMQIKKGDLLLKIKPDSYKALFEQQKAAISAAQALNLQQKAALVKAEQDFKRSQDLFDKKMISASEFSAAQAANDMGKSSYENSQHEIERAEAASSQARDQLSKTIIYSPIDGNVTILNSKLGERVVATNQFAGTEVLRVADLSHMQAVVDVNENDVVKVKIGDKAVVTIDAYNERKFEGVVAQIANTGTTFGTGTQEEVTNFQVKINIVENKIRLRPGLSCTADIQTDMVKKVVAVPMQAVTIRTGDSNLSPEEIERNKQKAAAKDKADNNAELTNDALAKHEQREEREHLQKGVFLMSGGKAHWTPVTTGIADDTYMEIKSGVNEGADVISGSYSAISRKLKNNAAVVLEKTKK